MQFSTARDRGQTIDDPMTQGAIAFLATMLQQRNPELSEDPRHLLDCIHSSHALILAALRQTDRAGRDSSGFANS